MIPKLKYMRTRQDDIRDPEPPPDREYDGLEWDEFDEWYDRQKDKEFQP